MAGENVLVQTLRNFQEILLAIAALMAAAIVYHFMPARVWVKIRAMLSSKRVRTNLVGPIDRRRYPAGASLYPEGI